MNFTRAKSFFCEKTMLCFKRAQNFLSGAAALCSKHAKTSLLGAIALCFLVSLFENRINSYWLFISYDVGINVILAVSLNLINGYTGQFSLGHAGFMAVGAYTSAVITNRFGELNYFAADGIFFIALIAGGIVAAGAGLLVGIPTLRLKGDYLAIVTLGFGEIIRVILQNMDAVGGARGLSVTHLWTNFFWAFGGAAVTIYIVTSLVNSTYGRGFIAVRDDEIAAEAMGINTTKYKVTAFVVGAFFAGIAGGLYAHSKQFLTPNGFGFMQSITFVVMVILGGMGNTIGVIIAAILLTLLPEGLRQLAGIEHLPGFTTERPLSWVGDTRMIIYSLLLIVLMLTRPQGLFSLKKFSSPK
ncbi:MAG TPA: branched-chain amino acid ABC transporter permease [Verrucomicrobiae bacterium]|nr:branched-chain amino acid ABC transporter permease [Verrucomicrobiae bacterium]